MYINALDVAPDLLGCYYFLKEGKHRLLKESNDYDTWHVVNHLNEYVPLVDRKFAILTEGTFLLRVPSLNDYTKNGRLDSYTSVYIKGLFLRASTSETINMLHTGSLIETKYCMDTETRLWDIANQLRTRVASDWSITVAARLKPKLVIQDGEVELNESFGHVNTPVAIYMVPNIYLDKFKELGTGHWRKWEHGEELVQNVANTIHIYRMYDKIEDLTDPENRVSIYEVVDSDVKDIETMVDELINLRSEKGDIGKLIYVASNAIVGRTRALSNGRGSPLEKIDQRDEHYTEIYFAVPFVSWGIPLEPYPTKADIIHF